MNRRAFYETLCAVAVIKAIARDQSAPVRTWYPHSIRELLSFGVEVRKVGISLCDVDMRVEGIHLNQHMNLGCKVYFEDVPQSFVSATANAMNVFIRDGSLHCDDVTFFSATGNEAGLLIHLEFTNGSRPILAFLTDSRYFLGLPITPNGGTIHVQMPRREGLIRLA
ncbi:MAG: hypothetical protein IPK75_18270 [Acidobacteria bacterium]|nr:hypothetical protein [Acidobacteriota bacterium]